ncbi:HMG-I and HMG-Y DNA-binding domain-containing protein [Paenibacillus sp. JDR-2]|uniref:HMG-I and HMG-Y DNA-binding domain-containing protein n=1 Tax=Paenibacillus sp. (strain JDR-2) TaxID=324057 RepID=UPI0001668DC6|nr:HMG-I and HMG-Y DNA-binding domain-containing protein [Paenibacillus sp. JDR-2]ACT03363.1 HMG-I and HMG-Y DNA-binding domain protein [Paenibacillus sp. JDR-2]
MADPGFAVKVTPELKEKINQFMKDADFDTNKEWFEHVISIYELNVLKQLDGTKRYADDLDSISHHLTRVQETIVHIIKKSSDTLNDQETTWKNRYEALEQQLQASEDARTALSNQLTETAAQAQQDKKELEELRKQSNLHETLISTLSNSLKDKDSEIENLRNERNQWNAINYPSEIHRLKEESQDLQKQLQKQQHEMTLIRMEYEHKLEIERLKASAALSHHITTRINTQENLDNTLDITDTDTPTPKKRGRPRKDTSLLTISGLQQPSTEFIVQLESNEVDEPEDGLAEDLFDDQEPYFPEVDEYLQDLQQEEQTDNDQQLEDQPEDEPEQTDKI